MLFEWNDLIVVISFHYRIKKQKFIQISNTIVNTIAQFAGWKCKTNFILNYIFIKNVYVYIFHVELSCQNTTWPLHIFFRGHRVQVRSRDVLLFQPGLKQEFLAVKFLLPGSPIFTDSEHDRAKYKFPFYFAAISRGRDSTSGQDMRHKTCHTRALLHISVRVGVVKTGEPSRDFGWSPFRKRGVN